MSKLQSFHSVSCVVSSVLQVAVMEPSTLQVGCKLLRLVFGGNRVATRAEL